jgi:sulfite reductase beta subunit-like hemoprotein
VQVISNKRSTERTERRSSYGLVRSLPVEGDAATAAALSVVREHFTGRPTTVARILDTGHSEVYNRLMLIGEKPMPLHLFVRLLLALPTEKARQAVQEIGSHLGLVVSLESSSSVADVKSEALEASAACGSAFATVHRAMLDSVISDEERVEVHGVVREAQRQLDDLTRVVR